MRKVRPAIVAVSVCGLLLAACGGDDDTGDAGTAETEAAETGTAETEPAETGTAETEPEESEPAEVEDVKLTLAWQAGENEAVDNAVAAFEEANPGVTVELQYAADADLQETVRTQLSAGTGPDVFMVWPGEGGLLAVRDLAAGGFLAPLDGLAYASAADESALSEGRSDGTLYMVLLGYGPLATIYNVDAVEGAGLSIPETWDDLIAFCADAKAAGKTAYGLGLQNGWTAQLIPYAMLAPLVTDVAAWNAELNDRTFNFAESEEWHDALTRQQEMADAGCFNDSPNGTDIDTAILPGVLAGDFLGVTSVAGHIGAILEGGEANLSSRPLPAVDSPDDNRIFMLPANGLGVNAASEHPELAMKLIDALSSVEFLNAYAEQSGFLPTVPNAEFEMSEALAFAWSYIEDGRTVSGPWIPGGDTQNAIINGVQEIFLGSVTVGEMLQNVQQAYEASE